MSVSAIGELARFVNGAAFKPDDWGEEGQRIIRIQNLTDPEKPFNRTLRVLPPALQVQPGDILVSWSASLGVFEWRGPDVGLLNQHIFRVLPDERRVDKRFLRHGLELALQEMARHLHGATMKHVNRGEFLSTKIYVPPLAEQRRIAEILDQADALRAKRRQSLARLDALTQSIFVEMFGGYAHSGWPVARLEDAADLLTGYPFSSSEFTTTGELIKLCRGANVLPGRVDWSDLAGWPSSRFAEVTDFELCADDVVIAMDRPWISSGFKIARVGICDLPALLVQRVMRVRARDRSSSRFLFELIRQPGFTRHCRPTETTIPHISPNDVKTFEFLLPPLPVRAEFARRTAAIDGMAAAQHASLVRFEALFASLQHRAFRGEL